ncbi:MAG: glycosyltransferase family 4 protein [Bdellovibrionia bacterium]
MKLAFVIQDIHPFGGQERSTLEIVNRFAGEHEVNVFATTFQGLDPKVRQRKVPYFFRRPVFLRDLVFRIFVTLLLLKEKFDVVHITGNSSHIGDIVTVQFSHARWERERNRLTREWNFRRVVQEIQMFNDLIWEWVVFKSLGRKDFIALSETVAEDLRRFYGIQKIHVIPHGVNLEEFQPSAKVRAEVRKEMGAREEETVILFVGTFERKGLFFLIPALRNLSAKRPFVLWVVGDGPLERAQELARKLGLEDKVKFTGHRKDVNRFFQGADLFILPSLYDPFGLVGIEALACGLPSIVSSASGVKQLIRDGYNGYVIRDADSVDQITESLDRILNEPDLSELARHARESVEKSSWNDVWPAYEKLFRDVAVRKSGRLGP